MSIFISYHHPSIMRSPPLALLILLLICPLNVLGKSRYVACQSSTTNVVLQNVGCDGITSATADCSTNSGMCLNSVLSTSTLQQRFACRDFCPDGYSEVSWEFSAEWAATCDPTCESHYYQTCRSTTDCREGTCCSLPSSETIQASGCGPPACFDCQMNGNVPEFIPCDGCGPIGYGTCIDSTREEIRPGYSCVNDPCIDMEDYVIETCGYYQSTNFFHNSLKVCSQACENAILGVLGCPNLETIVEAYRNFQGCTRCGDYYYERCADSSDCPVGFCCSLPPTEFVPGFFDESTCGPPETCECESTEIGQGVTGCFTETISCSSECGPRELGACEEIGASQKYNPLYSCDCTDPATFDRTASPTEDYSSSPSTTPPPTSVPSMTATPEPSAPEPSALPTISPFPVFTRPPSAEDAGAKIHIHQALGDCLLSLAFMLLLF
jgi:hypothetical protein